MQLVTQSNAQIKLSAEEFDEIERLAACNYLPQKIAVYIDVDVAEFMRQFNNPDSLVRHHYKKGVLESDYKISKKLLENAESGNITAVETFEKRQHKVNLEELKNRLFNDGY